jgi:hypothetical protein
MISDIENQIFRTVVFKQILIVDGYDEKDQLPSPNGFLSGTQKPRVCLF